MHAGTAFISRVNPVRSWYTALLDRFADHHRLYSNTAVTTCPIRGCDTTVHLERRFGGLRIIVETQKRMRISKASEHDRRWVKEVMYRA
jgi:hypothetical protein